MRAHEEAGIPGVFVTSYVSVLVVEPVVSEDLRVCWIDGANRGPAVEQAVELVKVNGLSYVGRDAQISVSDFGDPVYEDGEQDGDFSVFELPRHGDRFRCSPTVSIEDDSRVLLFDRAYDSVVIDIQLVQDLPKSPLAMGVLKDLRIDTNRMVLSEVDRELDLAVDDVVFLDIPSQESNHDNRRDRRSFLWNLPDGGMLITDGFCFY